jgi:hypothetical protein
MLNPLILVREINHWIFLRNRNVESIEIETACAVKGRRILLVALL